MRKATTVTASTSTPAPDPASTSGIKMSAHKAWASAIFSAVLAFLSSIATAVGGAETGFDSITFGQWLTAVIAALVAFAGAGGVTYFVPNNRLK
jgi:hypothetical protein